MFELSATEINHILYVANEAIEAINDGDMSEDISEAIVEQLESVKDILHEAMDAAGYD